MDIGSDRHELVLLDKNERTIPFPKDIFEDMLNTITNYRIGNIKRRRNLNSFATLLNINPKLYKKKSHLIDKLNKTIF